MRQRPIGRFLEIIRKILPEGRALPEKEWRARHNTILILTWLHAFGLTAFGLYQGFGALQSFTEGAIIAAAALAASWRRISRSARSAAASLGLITSSAILVQFSNGYIEAHFHFFVMLAVISLYHDWVPYLLAIIFVAVEHGVTGQFIPRVVYNHTDAFMHPWKWAMIHAGFVLFESVVLLANWRITEQTRTRIDLVLNSAGEAIIGLDLEGIISFANPAAANMTGYPLELLIGQPIRQIIPEADEISLNRDVDPAHPLLKGNAHHIDQVILRKNGTRLLVDSVSNPIRENGVVVGTVITLKDETKRRQAEEELKRTLSLLSATLESTADGILVVNEEGKIEKFNQKFIEMWNIPPAIVASCDDARVLSCILDQLNEPEEFLRNLKERYMPFDAESHDIFEFKNGRIFECYSKPQRIGGEHVGSVWSFRDITERKQAERRLNYLANFDSLTDLPNRTLFYDRLDQAIARAQWQKRPLAVLFLDLDQFKTINDTLGHAFGDLLLKLAAERLKHCVRDGDTIARLGGDEFVLILEDLKEPQDTLPVAQKILESLSHPFLLEGRELFITTSMGIALYPHDGENCETLLKNADTAMYRAKDQGRNNYQLYSAAFNARGSDRLTLEHSLRRAVERKEFQLYYQPKINLATGLIIGVESVIRWKYPDVGTIPPVEFITLAEETGLILPIGEWVLRTACAQNKAWQKAGLPPICVAVNVSARQFQRQNMGEMIPKTLDEVGLSPRHLELELTENTLMKSSEATVATLRQLEAIGIEISVDDFGTGYSSLSYLKRFPVTTLKIDRTFIRDLITDPDDRAIVTAIITLAHSLKLKVVAEAVETKEQLQFLRSLQCDHVQGYLFSQPIPAEEMTRLLSHQPCLQ